MTLTEMETELGRLREELLLLRNQQESQQKHWSRWGQIFLSFAGVLYVVIAALNVIYGTKGGLTDIAGILVILSLAFNTAPQPRQTATMSIKDRLRWIWSA